MRGIVSLLTPRYQLLPEAKPSAIVSIEESINLLFPEYLVDKCFIIPKETSDAKMMAEGKIIDVAVKKTSHSIHLPKQSHQTKSQEFPEHFHSFTNIIFQFKFRL